MKVTTSQDLAKGSALIVWLQRSLLVFLTGLAAWLSVRVGLALIAPSSLWTPVMIASPATTSVQQVQIYDFSTNPFAAGSTEDPVIAPVETGDDAPETTLDLELKGLRSGENGTAFIQTPDRQQDNFYMGQEIMPGVILRAVFPSYVLIDVNGQTQRLTTDDAKAARRETSVTTSTPRPDLQTLRTVDAATLLSQFEILPSFDADNARNGVTIRPRTSSVALSDFGLSEGDIIQRLAGQSLIDGIPDPASLRQAIGSGRSVTVDLLRNGQPMTITIGSTS